MTHTYDVAIVGGGVIGCAVAAELAERGAHVVLLEREHIGSGATGAAAGMLAPQSEAQTPDAWFRLLLQARAEHEPLACRLRHETGIDPGYRRDGVLRIAQNEAERRELQERGSWQREIGLAAEWLEPEDASRLEPALSADVAGALWLPDEAQVHSPRLVQALSQLAARRSAELREGAPVLGVETSGSRVNGVRTSTERILAETVVLAGGVWTGSIEIGGAGFQPAQAGRMPAPLPLEPVKGQIVSAVASPAAPRRMVWGSGAYLTPKADGQLLIGATEEVGESDTRTTLAAVAGLIDRGTALVPALANLPLNGAWAGLRPALPDRRPAFGRFGELEGLFVATGHYRNGILLGPLTGTLMARLILGETMNVDLEPYSPNRFARRPALTG